MTTDISTVDSNERGFPLIWTITALLVLVVIAVAGYKYREQMRNTVIATASMDKQCMVNLSPCTASLSNASAHLTISPQPIVATRPMQVSLQLEGLEAERVEIHFRGESMNMGLSQFTLVQQAGGSYSGEAILPVCVRNSMIWIADVLATTPNGKIAFPFRFESFHP